MEESRRRSADDTSSRDDAHSDLPRLYAVFKGEVASIQTYGAFVKIPGFSCQGLVHISQLSRERVDNVSDVLSKGETIYCKVINIDTDGDRAKVGLSMKLVNQTTGQDTDPNNVELTLDQNKKRSGQKRDFQKIELGAFLDTTCRKCGGKGHMTQDCFGDGKKYELIPEFDDAALDTTVTMTTKDDTETHQERPHKHRKQKKEKEKRETRKHKKRRAERESTSDSSHDHVNKKPRHSQDHSRKHRRKSTQ